MPAFSCGVPRRCCFFGLLLSLVVNFTWAQSETATVSGQVVDPSGLNIPGAQVKLVDIDRDTSTSVATSTTGLYTFLSIKPGRYRLEVTAAGFKAVNVTGLTVNVQDHLEQNFKLVVGSISESMTVTADTYSVNSTDATVSTVVDRNFAENLPMNGRSFQTLIQLTPGVVLTASNSFDSGQFSVNGQRATSNYWMLDGVSANIGVSAGQNPGNGLGGTLGSFSVLGGTNSLVSVDALQEFRIQTSTYAPEFGRTPGGQISIVTRSGTNTFHGTAFDYLRNDLFDASDWFNGYINNPPLPKARERQNDFGGTLSGPVFKDQTFFFLSYEGLRLRLPETSLTTVPDLYARQAAAPALRPYLNAFPFNPNQPDEGNGIAQFNASYSDPATLDAYSLRVDHRLGSKVTLFGRYNYSPSEIVQRGDYPNTLNTNATAHITTETATIGTTASVCATIVNDFRMNYSRTKASSGIDMDSFGGAVPLASVPLPDTYTTQDGNFAFTILSLLNSNLAVGKVGDNTQHQVNIVDNLSAQIGSHSLKIGLDLRRLSPVFDPASYDQGVFFLDVPSAETGSQFASRVISARSATLLFRNLGAFAQDTWRVAPRVILTYGLRWDVDFVPESLDGPNFNAVTDFNLNNLSQLALAPAGIPPYKTTFGNVAPRIGVAYQLFRSQDWQTVLRGGFGVFYDLASSEAGNATTIAYPFGAANTTCCFVGSFPLNVAASAPPSITVSSLSSSTLYAFDPHLQLPYSLQWNVAIEQALGAQQTITASYVGSAGRRLIQSALVLSPNSNLGSAYLVTNGADSDYNALQIQLQRRLSHGLQALASYTWSHSIDTASAGSEFGNSANALVPSVDPNENRGPSDFDTRDAISAGVTYDVPAPKINTLANALFHGWSLQNVLQAHSASPVDVSDLNFTQLNGAQADVRPDLVPGQSLYLYGAECLDAPPMGFGQACPGGKGFNPNAFTDPPSDSNGNPLRQGSLGRNALRGFPTAQWDLAVHRDFPLHESTKLQFRAEMFNVLNHPNFGPPSGSFGAGGFGLSSQMLGQSLNNGNLGGGGFSPLYQVGGPRSMQFALKLMF
jgi:hypothetical protein